MKITFFSDHFYPEPSAPAAHVYERSVLWCKGGHDVTVITNAPNTPMGRVYDGYRNRWRFVEYLNGVRVVRVKTYIAENRGAVRRIFDYLSYAVSSFSNSLLESRPDVVISTSPHLFVPVAGLAMAWLRRVPHVMEVRDLWPASIAATTNLKKGRLYRMLERLELFLYRKSARIIVLTPAFKENLISRNVPENKIDVVINGANLELFQPRERDEALASSLQIGGQTVIGYLGTLGLAHGLENVIEVARLMKDESVIFLFVGEGALKARLQDMVEQWQLRNVRFVARQRKEDMPGYWSVCDIALVHLRNDSVFASVIPSKIFEAMAVGLPVLYVGPRGQGSGIVDQHKAGLTVPAADPEAFSQALLRLHRDRELRKALAFNSRSSADQFSRETQADGTLMSLDAALGRNEASG